MTASWCAFWFRLAFERILLMFGLCMYRTQACTIVLVLPGGKVHLVFRHDDIAKIDY